jgi:hypothetical protein
MMRRIGELEILDPHLVGDMIDVSIARKYAPCPSDVT